MSRKQEQGGRTTPRFKVGDSIEATCSVGHWVGKVVGRSKRTGAAAERAMLMTMDGLKPSPADDGYAYETLGVWTSLNTAGRKPSKEQTLRKLHSMHMCLLGDDAVARAQQLAADVAAQDGLDAEEAGAMEQCMMDMLEQEGLL